MSLKEAIVEFLRFLTSVKFGPPGSSSSSSDGGGADPLPYTEGSIPNATSIPLKSSL